MDLSGWFLIFWMMGLPLAAVAQENRPPRSKPVLIRDDRTTNREAEVEVVEPDPIEAERHIRVGDFYFKRKNFKAAGERYREAVKHYPRRPDSYVKLIRTLEKMEEFEEAVAVCRQFIDTNPAASQVSEFRDRIKKLESRLPPPAP